MFTAIAAAAALPIVLGLQLGAPLTIPECQRMQLTYPHADGSPAPYTSVQPVECVEHDDFPKAGVDRGMIYFPPEAMPTIMGFNWAGDWLIGGRLASLSVATLDYNHADFIVAQLTAKFGKPSEDRRSSEDIESIAVPARIVVWARPGYRVEYRSINRTVERGLVLIQTDEALTLEERQRAADKAKQTPF
jgi:hypothetical protein